MPVILAEPIFTGLRVRQQLLPDILPQPAPTLENFVAGANGALLEALHTLTPGRSLYLWGPPGAGRSHLLQAFATAAPQRHYIAGRQAGELSALAHADALELQGVAVDDVHQLDPAGQAGLFALFNRWRSQSGGPQAFALVLAGERAPLAVPLREDLRSRLGWDLVFRLHLLSDEDRAAAMRTWASERGLRLGSGLVEWLLTHHTRDIRALQQLMVALDRHSLEHHRPITLPLVKALLAQLK